MIARSWSARHADRHRPATIRAWGCRADHRSVPGSAAMWPLRRI